MLLSGMCMIYRVEVGILFMKGKFCLGFLLDFYNKLIVYAFYKIII